MSLPSPHTHTHPRPQTRPNHTLKPPPASPNRKPTIQNRSNHGKHQRVIGHAQHAGPDLITKYNVLLSKTHTLATSLSTLPTRKGSIGFKHIVPTPFAVGSDPAPNPTDTLDAMLEALLDGRRSMGGEPVLPDVMLARLDEVQKAHDARCARGVEAVRQLKDKYDWKSRLLFDDSESESSVAVASHHSSEEVNSVVEDEEMVEVAPPPDEDSGLIEEEGDTPSQTRVFVPAAEDSDSDSEEEVVPGSANVHVNVPGGGEEGSESDGMEDVSVQPAYQNGPQQQQQSQADPPVSLLDNLFVIDQ
ncbi:hypothetical protein RSOL_217060 [Rhizoctonia solani AG-3 Rhs1AP]|uniref:Uncharacterized protein n=1 Tax=Rhizoctonia solani AG-3 Rhs1AP TaxID=1086054 RepID=X8J4N8_9AGAM|nr:hypothetical protein RSOL_217060 [Rhizoctonia solani AG-3 Rhs1AP]